jgi:hypothetical protein
MVISYLLVPAFQEHVKLPVPEAIVAIELIKPKAMGKEDPGLK